MYERSRRKKKIVLRMCIVITFMCCRHTTTRPRSLGDNKKLCGGNSVRKNCVGFTWLRRYSGSWRRWSSDRGRLSNRVLLSRRLSAANRLVSNCSR